jgi:hypothetical protein
MEYCYSFAQVPVIKKKKTLEAEKTEALPIEQRSE